MNYNSVKNANDLLNRMCTQYPNAESVYDGTTRMTFADVQREVERVAAFLQQHGVEKGERVAIAMTNCSQYVVIFHAILKIGGVVVPVNPNFQEFEAAYILSTTEPKVIFADEVNYYEDINGKQETPYTIVTMQERAEGFLHYDDVIAQTGEVEEVVVLKDDLGVIMFTSGTTGQPKGAMLTQGNILYSAHAGAQAMEATEEDVYLIPNPLFHIMGVTFMLRALWTAAKLVIMPKYSVRRALKIIESEKITIHPGVPTMFILELNSEHFDQHDLSSLRTGEMAAAPCPMEVVKQIRNKMNCNILVAYGATETSATLTITNFDDSDQLRAETVGRPIPGVEVRVVDDYGMPCSVGEIGELVCRGPGVMKGYYKMPTETEEAFDEYGFFRTGDMATIDENGYVRIVGRKKELIIRGGFNIYPREIEESLHEHEEVAEAAVVGVPDPVFGEVPVACVVLKDESTLTEEQLTAYITERFVKYKIPDRFIIMRQLPVTASGKISKMELKNQLQDHLLNQ